MGGGERWRPVLDEKVAWSPPLHGQRIWDNRQEQLVIRTGTDPIPSGSLGRDGQPFPLTIRPPWSKIPPDYKKWR